MATTQLIDGTIRICKDTSPTPRTEWRLEVTAKNGTQVTLGLDYPLREFLREALGTYPDDVQAPRPFEFFDDNDQDNFEDDGFGDSSDYEEP
jgi:hypothetical protein